MVQTTDALAMHGATAAPTKDAPTAAPTTETPMFVALGAEAPTMVPTTQVPTTVQCLFQGTVYPRRIYVKTINKGLKRRVRH